MPRLRRPLVGILIVAAALVSAEEQAASATCGAGLACNDAADVQAQGAAQGLLSMGTVAHRPLANKPTLGLQEPVTITSVSSHVQNFGQPADEAALAQHKLPVDVQETGSGEAQTTAKSPGAADNSVTDAAGKASESGQVSTGAPNISGKQLPQALMKFRELSKGSRAKKVKCKPCVLDFFSDLNCARASAVSGAAGRMKGSVEKKDMQQEVKSVRFNKQGCTLWLYTETFPKGRVWVSPRERVCLQKLVDREQRPIGKVLMATTIDDTCQP